MMKAREALYQSQKKKREIEASLWNAELLRFEHAIRDAVNAGLTACETPGPAPTPKMAEMLDREGYEWRFADDAVYITWEKPEKPPAN